MFKMLKYQLEYVWARLGEKGQGVVEYALILAFVVALVVFALGDNTAIGQSIRTLFANTAAKINAAAGTGATGAAPTNQ